MEVLLVCIHINENYWICLSYDKMHGYHAYDEWDLYVTGDNISLAWYTMVSSSWTCQVGLELNNLIG